MFGLQNSRGSLFQQNLNEFGDNANGVTRMSQVVRSYYLGHRRRMQALLPKLTASVSEPTDIHDAG